jgi:ribosomal-protein-alanine N-acetyltransferase
MIETPRLLIRQRTPEDAQIIHAAKLAVKAELMRWMSWASEDQFTIEATQAFIHKRDEREEKLDGLLGFDRESGELAAMCGLRSKTPGVYETGYWVTKPFLGRGYATEACHAMILYAFDQLGAKAVVISHFDGNDKSQRVIKKLGFEFTHIMKEGIICHALGHKVDHWYYQRENARNLSDIKITW